MNLNKFHFNLIICYNLQDVTKPFTKIQINIQIKLRLLEIKIQNGAKLLHEN